MSDIGWDGDVDGASSRLVPQLLRHPALLPTSRSSSYWSLLVSGYRASAAPLAALSWQAMQGGHGDCVNWEMWLPAVLGRLGPGAGMAGGCGLSLRAPVRLWCWRA